MAKLLTDPNIFNYVILGLFVLNAGRWFIAANQGQVVYWIGCTIIQLAVTFFMEHK